MKRALETVFKEDVQRVFDHFSACFDIRILFYTPTGEMPRVGRNQPDSLYCRLVQEHLYGEGECLALDEMKRQESSNLGQMICYKCHAGLVEAMKPVYFDKTLLGYIAIGQFRSEQNMPENVALDWNSRIKNDDLQNAFLTLPYVPQDRINDILGLFSVLVDYIVSKHMVSLRGNLDLQEILTYLENNICRDIALAEVADRVGKSTSTISHLFRREFGRSFKQTLVELKLQNAEERLATVPGITIKEAAASVGYDDPLYFSRIYKKYRGVPPSAFKRKSN